MTLRKHTVALIAVSLSLVFAGSATAAFPNFSDCPLSNPSTAACIDVQATSGNLNIKGFNVPLGASLEIRGGLTAAEERTPNFFIPPVGSNGFFATPVPVPGGLLGIEWIPGTSVLAITELAGPASGIRIDFENQGLSVPVKVRLVNTLIGMNCHIGTDRNPVRLNLITGTTAPPPPNRPITGHLGGFEIVPPDVIKIPDVLDVENSFAVPGASECGFGLGLISALVNAKLRIPSAAGNNSIEIHNNIGIRFFAE
jgi:hypothetical protein